MKKDGLSFHAFGVALMATELVIQGGGFAA